MCIMPGKLTLPMFCLLATLAVTPLVLGQENAATTEFPRVEDWGLLRDDPRLQKRISMDAHELPISDILARLQQMTGVQLVIDAAEAKQTFGMLKGSGPAWKFMRQIVITKGIQGRWERSGNGYRLHFRHETDTPSRGNYALWWMLGAGVPVFLTGMLLVFSGRRRTEKPAVAAT